MNYSWPGNISNSSYLGFSSNRNRTLSVIVGSFVIPRRSLKRNVTFVHSIGVTRFGVHSSYPTLSAISALERITVPSPGACSLTLISPVLLLAVRTASVGTASPAMRYIFNP